MANNRNPRRVRDDEDVIGWYPTPQEFEAYQTREVEMAKANFTLDGRHADANLHSHETCMKAILEMRRAQGV